MVLLQNAQPRADRRSMCEDEYLPALRGRVADNQVLEPLELLVVNGHLVRGVLSAAKHSRAQANKQGLLGNEPRELRRGLAMNAHEGLQVCLVSREFIDPFKVVVATNDLVWHIEGRQEFGGQLMALGCTCEELVCLFWPYRLGLPQITQTDECGSNVSLVPLLEKWLDVVSACVVVIHLPWVEVEVSKNGNDELVLATV
mmetsp:Transcript_60690/g.157812  ORF Transcript_60690/g.157812 Transcript_60690/m.157812 type:complete len:200 (-) Transcript_60690:315-914(-)